MSHTTAIPNGVFDLLSQVRPNHPGAFDVRIQGFEGDDGKPAFAIEFFDDSTMVTPGDRRQKRYLEARKTTYYFNSAGGFDGEPSVYVGRWGSMA